MPGHRQRAITRSLAAALMAVACVALGLAMPAEAVTTAVPSKPVSTRTLLAQLAVGQEYTAGYSATAFGRWRDDDRDGCSTPAEVFLAEAVRQPTRGAGCRLIAGRWVSRYDGRAYNTTSGMVIDHVVSLREAWQSGAHTWDTATRRSYLNDLGYARTMVAVSAGADRAKGENEPHHWMPARARCDYLVSWVGVKWRWRLKTHAIERAYLDKGLRACGWPAITAPSRPRIGTRAAAGSVAPSGWSCPASAPIKGNAESMIYHLPGDAYYTRTNPEDCFATETAARAAGYRRAKI